MWTRGMNEPTRPGECTFLEPHRAVCAPCALEEGDIHDCAAEVAEIMRNSLDLLRLAVGLRGELTEHKKALLAAAGTMLERGLAQLDGLIVDETMPATQARRTSRRLRALTVANGATT